MASSSQNSRYQDRLTARQRGAGTRKVSDVGINFNLDLAGMGLSLPVAALPRPPPQRQQQLPADSKITGLEPTAPLHERQLIESGPLQLSGQGRESPVGSLVVEPPTRRTSPRTNVSQSTIPDAGRAPIPKSADVARTSPHAIPSAAVALVAPEPRGKRRRQPSPDKFLDTPDRKEMQQSRQMRLGNGVKSKLAEKLAERKRGAGTHKVADPGFDIEGLDELVEQTRKRRKVTPQPEPQWEPTLEQAPEPTEPGAEPNDEIVPSADEMEVEPSPATEPATEDEPSVQGLEAIAAGEEDQEGEDDNVRIATRKSPRVNKEPIPQSPAVEKEDGAQTPIQQPARQRTRGKKPPSPKVTTEEEREAEEAELAVLLQVEAEAKAEAQREREVQAKKDAMRKRKEQARADALFASEAEKKAREDAKSKAKGKGRAATARPRPEPDTESEPEAEGADEGLRMIADEDQEIRPIQPKKKRRSRTQEVEDEAAEGAPTRRRERGLGVPITVLRYPKGDQAPPPPGGNRKGVNHIDMIFTLFIEVIDRDYTQLQTTREKKAIENYKEEVAARLRTYTEAVEGYLNIQSRTRQAKKRHNQLQQELLEVDRQRRAVAVKMDEVRHNHETASKKNERRQRAGSAFEDIAGIVELAEARSRTLPADEIPPSEGLEALLAMVAPVVTGGGEDGSGILSQVIGFNRLLESATKALIEYNAANGVA